MEFKNSLFDQELPNENHVKIYNNVKQPPQPPKRSPSSRKAVETHLPSAKSFKFTSLPSGKNMGNAFDVNSCSERSDSGLFRNNEQHNSVLDTTIRHSSLNNTPVRVKDRPSENCRSSTAHVLNDSDRSKDNCSDILNSDCRTFDCGVPLLNYDYRSTAFLERNTVMQNKNNHTKPIEPSIKNGLNGRKSLCFQFLPQKNHLNGFNQLESSSTIVEIQNKFLEDSSTQKHKYSSYDIRKDDTELCCTCGNIEHLYFPKSLYSDLRSSRSQCKNEINEMSKDQTSVKDRIKNFNNCYIMKEKKESCANIEQDKRFICRMLTFLPPSVYVSSNNANIEKQIVHSEPLSSNKLQCTHEIKPLKLYLEKYGQDLALAENYSNVRCSTIKKHLENAISNKNNIQGDKRNSKNVVGRSMDDNKDRIKTCIEDLNSKTSTAESHSSESIVNKNKVHFLNSKFTQFVNQSPNITTETTELKPNHKNSGYSVNGTSETCNKITIGQSPLDLDRKSSELATQTYSVGSQFANNKDIKLKEYSTISTPSLDKLHNYLQVNRYNSQYENFCNTNSSKNYRVNKFNIKWKSFSFFRWNQEKCLRVRHASVEDLKQRFQISECVRHSKTTFEMSYQYKRLLCNVSVSNLVKRFNGMKIFHEMVLRSKTAFSSEHKNQPLFFHEKNLSISNDDMSRRNGKVGLNQLRNERFKKIDHKFTADSDSTKDIDSVSYQKSFRNKVRFFEDISHQYEPKQVRTHLSHRNLTRNSSYNDLMELDEKTVRYSKLFSPHYLPERAVSCLDLSFASIDSSNEPSSYFCDGTSSSISIMSSECTKYSDVTNDDSIIRGMVSQLTNKFENTWQLVPVQFQTRSCSMPDKLAASCSKFKSISNRKNTESCFSDGRWKSGSVKNLIQKFESCSDLSTHHRKSKNTIRSNNKVGYLSSFHVKVQTTNKDSDYFISGNKLQSSSFKSGDDFSESSLQSTFQDSLRSRIQNMMTRFENKYEKHLNDFNICKIIVDKSKICSEYKNNFKYDPLPTISLNRHIQHIEDVTNHSWTFYNSDLAAEKKFSKFNPGASTSRKSTNVYTKFLKSHAFKVKNSTPRPYVKKNFGCSIMSSKASPHQYQETEVNIHFKSPIRHLEKEYIEEEELKKRQEDAMRKLYDEERKKKQLQEMAEIEMRKHSDFFTPSEKSPISLSRYDNPFESDRLTLHNGPPPKTMARALYPFTAQTTRELSLNRSDIVYITKQIDRNWYEGEHHGLVGIFPVSYVEIIPNEKANFQPRKAIEGEAIVKFNFRAQTPLELSLFKGERVVLVKRMDPNWYEGRLGAKKGIFPVSYVEVLQDPGEIIGTRAVSPKPPASPIFGPIVNGCPPKSVEGPSYNTGLRPLQGKPPIQIEKSCQLTQSLHIDTYNEPIPYRSLYSYKPQNDDELDLQEGDTVYVMEKCDDGWYVGTSLRTGLFGTFPGNYVERI